MTQASPLPTKDPAKGWILLGIAVISIIGSLMHFVYDWSGKATIVGIIAPTNESIWEHLKMTLWPILIWWFVGYLLHVKNKKISSSLWFLSCLISELVCPLIIVAFYYTYTGALGIESLILDIFSLFLGVAIGQVISLHLYKHSKAGQHWLYIAIVMLILLITAFTAYTFEPPHIPLFMDSTSGKYGI